ncbi:hypothetical protein Scep_017435 [Stephania cephalantha]|uniref:Uncharacterized protein n=1 Tax=Stephania cephalantha TaxID=152367 RepID=A0AAP0IRD7_9MAGN
MVFFSRARMENMKVVLTLAENMQINFEEYLNLNPQKQSKQYLRTTRTLSKEAYGIWRLSEALLLAYSRYLAFSKLDTINLSEFLTYIALVGILNSIQQSKVQFSRDGNYLYTGSRRVGFVDKLQKRRQELTQTTPDQPVDDEAVYYKVAGDCPKGCVYSLRSLWRKKRRYVDPDASTS